MLTVLIGVEMENLTIQTNWNIAESIARVKKTSRAVENLPELFYKIKFELAQELYVAKFEISNSKIYKWSDYLKEIGMSAATANSIIKHYNPFENRLMSTREVNLISLKESITNFRKSNKMKVDDKLIDKKSKQLLRAYALNIFKDREAGKEYYKDKIKRDVRNYMKRLTSEEVFEISREIVSEIKKIVDDRYYNELDNNKR